MHDQPSPDPALREARAERAVLALLLDCDHHGVWSLEELAFEIGDRLETEDALARLRRAGLVHRCGQFAFVTRPAARLAQLPGP